MPAYATNYTTTLQSMTRQRVVSDKVVDTVFKAIKVLQWLRSKNLTVTVKGGLYLQQPINVSASPNTQTFDGADVTNLASMNTNVVTAAWDYKKYIDSLVVLDTDLLLTDGSPDAVANYVDVQVDVVKMSVMRKLNIDIMQNTQSIDPKGINGVKEAVDDGTINLNYGGISRTTYSAQWKSQTNYTILSVANGGAPLTSISSLDALVQIDAERPDAYFTTPLNWATIRSNLYSQDHFIQPDMARAIGGWDLMLNGNPLYIDNYIQTGIATPGTAPGAGANSGGFLYLLNSTYFKWVVDADWDFELTEWQRPVNQMEYITHIKFAGNMICVKPSSQAVAWIQGG
jgi:hypothetical protein